MEEKEIMAERRAQDLQLDKRNLENNIRRLENELSLVGNRGALSGQLLSQDKELLAVRQRLEQARVEHKEEMGKQKKCVAELQEQKACQTKQLECL